MREFCVDSRDMKTKLACYAWEPKADAKAVLIMAHGMAEHLMRYEEMAEYFVSQGIIFAGPDHLGHGKSAPAPDDLGYFCEQDPATVVVRDLHRVKKNHTGRESGSAGLSYGTFHGIIHRKELHRKIWDGYIRSNPAGRE